MDGQVPGLDGCQRLAEKITIGYFCMPSENVFSKYIRSKRLCVQGV
jgi:hypothetical protein